MNAREKIILTLGCIGWAAAWGLFAWSTEYWKATLGIGIGITAVVLIITACESASERDDEDT